MTWTHMQGKTPLDIIKRQMYKDCKVCFQNGDLYLTVTTHEYSEKTLCTIELDYRVWEVLREYIPVGDWEHYLEDRHAGIHSLLTSNVFRNYKIEKVVE